MRAKKVKTPSLLVQIIHVLYEQHLRRKAIRILEKQTWSMDFLSATLVKAAKLAHEPLELVITNGPNVIRLVSTSAPTKVQMPDDDIFNHLDDDLAVARFIREHSSR